MQTHKAKTSPTGYVARIQRGPDRIEFPVARFDDEGYAMILMDDGKLARAADNPGFVHTWPMLQAASR